MIRSVVSRPGAMTVIVDEVQELVDKQADEVFHVGSVDELPVIIEDRTGPGMVERDGQKGAAFDNVDRLVEV